MLNELMTFMTLLNFVCCLLFAWVLIASDDLGMRLIMAVAVVLGIINIAVIGGS